MRRFQIILVVLLIGLAGYLGSRGPEYWSGDEEEKSPEEKKTSSDQEKASPAVSKSPDKVPDGEEADFRFTRRPDGRVEWNPSIQKSRELHQGEDPERDLDLISQIFSAYRLVYRENPVGTENFEFVSPLLGDNPKKVVFLPRDHPALKGNILRDRWGTPYHFHPLSGQKLDIRSAGPDREFWTEDDLSLVPKEGSGGGE